MKNALTWGAVIGVLSAAWLFVTHSLGYDTYNEKISPFEYISILIPVAGLFFGIRSYRSTDCGGNMGFLEALMQGFKILLFGGILSVFAGIVYINYVQAGNNLATFSGRMFAALLIGLLSALAVSLILATKSNKVD